MPSRHSFVAVLFLCLGASPALAQPAKPDVGPAGVAAKAWAIADGKTGKVLWGFREAETRDIASTTKIMTAWIILQRADKNPKWLDEEIRFSERAAAIKGSSCRLKVGERLRAIVGVERRLGFPLAHEHEPAGIGQGRGEDVAPAARLAAGPTAKALEQRRELGSPCADPEHLGDGNHGHVAQLDIPTSTPASARAAR